jgi:membrane associated rhomboid family serine protease
MATTVFALLVLSGAALYFMSAQERARLLGNVVGVLRRVVTAAAHGSTTRQPFDEFLRARTGRPIVTPLLAAVNVLVFMLVVFNRQSPDDTQTLIEWGGNFAPRTTNGEWWRLLSAAFVHGGLFQLLVTLLGLVPLGLILERAVGRVAFAAVYLTTALLAGVVSLWTTSPTSVNAGASDAVLGVYGLLLSVLAWSVVQRPTEPMAMPWLTVRRLAAAAMPFLLYNSITGHFDTPSAVAGLATGLAGGLVVAKGVAREKPSVRRAVVVMAATVLIVIGAALPFRGIVDFTPEIAGIVAVEQRTAGAYDTAVVKFRLGRLSAKALVQLIDKTIIPDLQAAGARVKALRGIPPEQKPLVAAAEEYFRLREQSWRDRITGLLKSKHDLLRKAEETERAALDAFRRIQPEVQELPSAGD